MTVPPWAIVVGYALVAPLLWWAGNAFCRFVLAASGAGQVPPAESDAPAPPADEGALRAGRFIGVLERSLVLIGIVSARWEVVAGVVALKTVARYKELDDRFNAEYFLIGSLASILWAVLVALGLVLFDAHLGFGIVQDVKLLVAR
jgi:hypothetical protein